MQLFFVSLHFSFNPCTTENQFLVGKTMRQRFCRSTVLSRGEGVQQTQQYSACLNTDTGWVH